MEPWRDELYHFGIKGMKWRKHKMSSYESAGRNLEANARRAAALEKQRYYPGGKVRYGTEFQRSDERRWAQFRQSELKKKRELNRTKKGIASSKEKIGKYSKLRKARNFIRSFMRNGKTKHTTGTVGVKDANVFTFDKNTGTTKKVDYGTTKTSTNRRGTTVKTTYRDKNNYPKYTSTRYISKNKKKR